MPLYLNAMFFYLVRNLYAEMVKQSLAEVMIYVGVFIPESTAHVF